MSLRNVFQGPFTATAASEYTDRGPCFPSVNSKVKEFTEGPSGKKSYVSNQMLIKATLCFDFQRFLQQSLTVRYRPQKPKLTLRVCMENSD